MCGEPRFDEAVRQDFDYGDDCGQMSVELVMALPVFLLGLVLMFNVMTFLAECSRFDRTAGEVARAAVLRKVIDGPSPSATLQICLGYRPDSPFSAKIDIAGGLHPQVRCILTYRPWPRLGYSLFGIKVGEWRHAQSFVVDDFDPAIVF